MKKIQILTFTILILAAMSTISSAGDYAEMKFIGFSEDGKYLAFEQYGDWDVHVGGSYATTYFVDVEKNVYDAAPSVFDYSLNTEQHTGLSEAAKMSRYKASVAAGIKRFKIVIGNTGKLVAAHLETDRSFEKPEMREVEKLKSDGTSIKKLMPFYQGDSFLLPEHNPNKIIFNPIIYPVNPDFEKLYELELKHIAAEKPCEAKGNVVNASIIELTIKQVDHQLDSPLQILQRDKTLPEVRGCPYAYRIEQVFLYKDNLAVFINVYTMGFPGSTMRYMVVTSKHLNNERINK